MVPLYPCLRMDPRLLPQTAGPSQYPGSQRFVACPANWQPWGTLHVRPVFLPVLVCKRSSKSSRHAGEMYYVTCKSCNYRAFFAGPFWIGNTRDEIVANLGHGIAVDDLNCYL